MRFYVPEWDDAVDAKYDFVHDELSVLEKSERSREYIWDVFDRASTPIDGVLISREQVEGSPEKFDRLTSYGVYDDPELSIPEWLPTISDCGAWGYKGLPFPPYSNEGMLDFYETLDVDVGVTIDHLILGEDPEQPRLYLDETYLDDSFDTDAIPDSVTDMVDLMVSEWPDTWPEYVEQHNPSITGSVDANLIGIDDFRGPWEELIERWGNDPRMVYRPNDNEIRYDLTLDNAREMGELYEAGDYSFRLMAAFQGWDPESYGEAVSGLLDTGYQYVGIGGVAGSSVRNVQRIVAEVGRRISTFEREHDTRVDCHVFGFAKTRAFETVGRSGMASFDSASMLRAAWTGGNNYHLTPDDKYDAIRVRYPPAGDSLSSAIETALWAREILAALRAYDDHKPIAPAIESTFDRAWGALDGLETYLINHRHDARFDQQYVRDVRREFRDHYSHSKALFASFGKGFRRELIGMLREDDAEDPIKFHRYQQLLDTAASTLSTFPRTAEEVADRSAHSEHYDTVCTVLEAYVGSERIQDRNLFEDYQETLKARPWEECGCPICEDLGIEVAIFRGNNRNRRRGFHNTRRFYDVFERELPKISVLVQADTDLFGANSVESYLKRTVPECWEAIHDLPVVELGVFDATGVHEWWEDAPGSVSLDPGGIKQTLARTTERYSSVYVLDPEETIMPTEVPDGVTVIGSPLTARAEVLSAVGYEENWLAHIPHQAGLGDY
ncbi:hypothetical protein GCM10028857_03160 [Salinarchaeum chitinilyticum]